MKKIVLIIVFIILFVSIAGCEGIRPDTTEITKWTDSKLKIGCDKLGQDRLAYCPPIETQTTPVPENVTPKQKGNNTF
jgi:hypothetical protein